MKSRHVFSKVFVFATLWTVVFLSVAGYAVNETYQQDPELIQKVSDKRNWKVHMGGMSKNFGGKNYVESNKSWTFPSAISEISLKSVSGKFSVKKSSGTEIVVTATGDLDSNIAPQLLVIKQDDNTLTLEEPDDNATRDLQVNIEIPDGMVSKFEMGTVSGDMTFENLRAKDLAFKAVSGDLILNKVIAERLTLKGVSSDLKAENCEVKKLVVTTVSGEVEFSTQNPTEIDISTTSGDIKVKLPKTQDARYDLSTTSGKIDNAHGSNKASSLEVKIHTTSGDIDIE